MTYIEKLKAACAAATAGPCSVVDLNEGDPPEYGPLWAASIGDPMGDDGTYMEAQVNYGDRGDAELLALLCNARDEIVAVVEAAEKADDALGMQEFGVTDALSALAAKIGAQP